MNDLSQATVRTARASFSRLLAPLLAAGLFGIGAISSVPVVAADAPAAASTMQRTAMGIGQPRWASAANDRGALDAGTQLTLLSLELNRSPARQLAFDQFLQAQKDPGSPDYHHWLTSTEIGERFGAEQSDIDAVTSWLTSQGLHVDEVSNSRTRIRFSGTAGQIASAFATELHTFQVGTEQRFANTRDPSLPSAIAAKVRAINGLSTQRFAPMHHSRLVPGSSAAPAAGAMLRADTYCTGGTCVYTVFPADFATIYNINPVYAQGINGSGQTIGIIGRTRVYCPDITNYASVVGLTLQCPTAIIPPDGFDPGPAASTCSGNACNSDAIGDQSEATMDVQVANSTAPGATIVLIASADDNTTNTDGVDIAMQYAIDTNPVPAHILNVSYATCEADNSRSVAAYLDGLFAQAEAEGISVFVASGDAGVAGCADWTTTPDPTNSEDTKVSPNILCASGHVTCAGGTQFSDAANPSQYWASSDGDNYGSALSYIPEGAWNEPLDDNGNPQYAATGGGVSSYIATPAWQTGTGVPSARAGRYTPDVSLNASMNEGYFSCFAAQNGSCASNSQGYFYYFVVGGTSTVAPGLSGITALLNQKAGGYQGNLNSKLYSLAATPSNGVFHDVTVATSAVSPCVVATPSACNNSTPGATGLSGGVQGYAVTAGYDLATGLGSIDVTNLLTQWSGSGNNTSGALTNLDQFGLTGSWYNPATNGQGLEMEVIPDVYGSGQGLLFGGWYTYDTTAAGGQRWYTVQGIVSSTSNTAVVPIFLNVGGQFASPQAVTTTQVGAATVQFSDCNTGTLTYSFTDGSNRSGSFPLTRIVGNITCGPSGDTGAAAGHYLLSGAWNDTRYDGQGLVLDINPPSNNLFAGWYAYGATATTDSGPAGQIWFTVQSADWTPSTTSLSGIPIYATTGGAFDQSSPATTTTPVGTANLTFQSCTAATLNYTFTGGPLAGTSGTYNLSRTAGIGPQGCTL